MQYYDKDILRRKANAAVRDFGHGRIKRDDGSFVDIGSHCGGITRTILDGWRPIDVPPPSDDEETCSDPTGK